MSSIIVELGDAWARKWMERNDADALDFGSLLETARALGSGSWSASSTASAIWLPFAGTEALNP
jgi:hypothetical protein